MRNGWTYLVAGVTVLVYIVYIAMAVWTFYNLPPIPEKVVTKSGQLLFTAQDVIEGKVLAQKYGLLDYGSFLGFGGYFGIDYTAYTLKFYVDKVKELRGLSLLDVDVKQLITPQLTARSSSVFAPASGVAVVSDEFGRAFGEAVKFYGELFGPRAESIGLKPNLITNQEEVRKIVAFFTWGVMIAMANYTNGFPYMPGILGPNIHVTVATWVTFFVLLLVIMPLAGYIIIKFLDYWKEPRVTLQLPPPGPAQRLALLGFALAVLGLSVQGLLGGYLMHKYVEPAELYGISGINNILPFNVARGLHYNLAVLWIAVSWVFFALFVLPYLGVQLSRARVLAILGAGAVTALGILLGLWASYLRLLPDPLWFIIGSQGRPVISQGTLWLLLIAALLSYLSLTVWRASKTSPEPIQPLVKILAIALAGTAFGAFIGALPVVTPWWHFTIDEYFRWITIHSFVEGFWPAIVIPILLILLVIAGMVPPKMAVAAAGIDATLEIATGMIGTAHHYYWGGQSLDVRRRGDVHAGGHTARLPDRIHSGAVEAGRVQDGAPEDAPHLRDGGRLRRRHRRGGLRRRPYKHARGELLPPRLPGHHGPRPPSHAHGLRRPHHAHVDRGVPPGGRLYRETPPPPENRRRRDGGRLLPTGPAFAHVAHD
jgi:nitric oxide reductase subunit B